MRDKTIKRGPSLAAARAETSASLDAILAAWDAATDRLQASQESLRREVRRLNDELEAKTRELARKNRLADLGLMASHVAHEVRNGLAPLTLYLSLLRRRMGDDARAAQYMKKIESAVLALESSVHDLLDFSSSREPCRQLFIVRGMLEEICGSIQPQLVAQRITVKIDADAQREFQADPHMLRRAVLNLVLNAVDAMPAGGELVLTVGAKGDTVGAKGDTECGGEDLKIEVADSGPGLAEATLARVFEPFFTTKDQGVGLGLAIVSRIAQAHGGTVAVRNGPQGGAAFTLHIPSLASYPKDENDERTESI